MDPVPCNIIVEVCGGIASGKTTFANLMQRIGFNVICEDFSTNPFWEAFYSNPGEYIFETEISFLLQHYHQIKKSQANDKVNICDYSFFLDKAYAEIGLKDSKLSAFMTVHDEVRKELQEPSLLVYLKCDPEIELERIRKRARSVEKNISLRFLEELNLAIEQEVINNSKELNVFTVDSGTKNFAHVESVKKEVVDDIVKLISF